MVFWDVKYAAVSLSLGNDFLFYIGRINNVFSGHSLDNIFPDNV